VAIAPGRRVLALCCSKRFVGRCADRAAMRGPPADEATPSPPRPLRRSDPGKRRHPAAAPETVRSRCELERRSTESARGGRPLPAAHPASRPRPSRQVPRHPCVRPPSWRFALQQAPWFRRPAPSRRRESPRSPPTQSQAPTPSLRCPDSRSRSAPPRAPESSPPARPRRPWRSHPRQARLQRAA
jgi:hypothetical protein